METACANEVELMRLEISRLQHVCNELTFCMVMHGVSMDALPEFTRGQISAGAAGKAAAPAVAAAIAAAAATPVPRPSHDADTQTEAGLAASSGGGGDSNVTPHAVMALPPPAFQLGNVVGSPSQLQRGMIVRASPPAQVRMSPPAPPAQASAEAAIPESLRRRLCPTALIERLNSPAGVPREPSSPSTAKYGSPVVPALYSDYTASRGAASGAGSLPGIGNSYGIEYGAGAGGRVGVLPAAPPGARRPGSATRTPTRAGELGELGAASHVAATAAGMEPGVEPSNLSARMERAGSSMSPCAQSPSPNLNRRRLVAPSEP